MKTNRNLPEVLSMRPVSPDVPASRLPALQELHNENADDYSFRKGSMVSMVGYTAPLALIYMMRQPCEYRTVAEMVRVFSPGRSSSDDVDRVRSYLARIGDDAASRGLCLLVRYAEKKSGQRGALSAKLIEPELMTTEDIDVLDKMKARVVSDIKIKEGRKAFYESAMDSVSEPATVSPD